MEIFNGISSSDGIGIGRAFVIPKDEKRIIPSKKIKSDEKFLDWKRFEDAKSFVLEKLNKNYEEATDKVQKEIFETYIAMLCDAIFIKELKDSFESENYNIEYILDKKVLEYSERLKNSGNEYLSERATDVLDVFGRVLNKLLDFHSFDIEDIPEEVIVVAHSLSPSDTIVLSKRKILALALTDGGVSSHVAILARNYGIPSVFSLDEIYLKIASGEDVIVDGKKGIVIKKPDEKTLRFYVEKIEDEKKHQEKLKDFRDKKAVTKDGVEFKLFANIGNPEEASIAEKEGVDGIGLFRTEFLFMSEYENTDTKSAKGKEFAFSEDNQFLAYKKVLQVMKNKPVTIRTLDAGGDKLVDISEIKFDEEKNPLMGLRAIRLSLMYPEVFKTQLRALFRASIYGNLKIMIPLVSTVEQLLETRNLIKNVCNELKEQNISFREDVPIGIMVETASAAIISDCLATHSDFFSIGTNDLTQYTIGIDRENSSVCALYNELHLSVLRMINTTFLNAQKKGIPVSVCGEMASREESALVLAALGIRNLSVGVKKISSMKELLSRFTMSEIQSISSKFLNNL